MRKSTDAGQDHWNRVQELFLTAAELGPGERARFLDFACGGDNLLREEIDSLLARDAAAESDLCAVVVGAAESLLPDELSPGTRVGAWRLVREIGRGGMGSVYLAARDDEQFEKRAAIKLVRRGMDTADLLDRFCHERQILANLDHPYIARLMDGGCAADGRPFLVMEYVEGEPIDQYCGNRNLTIEEQCRLFLKVCEAVSHAHRNLVVHRDLKPGNILIDSAGSPKLLDFGVAKILHPDLDLGLTATMALGRPLTPGYASPEQVWGTAVSTATDIYSLGAILYELPSGAKPHQFASANPSEIARNRAMQPNALQRLARLAAAKRSAPPKP